MDRIKARFKTVDLGRQQEQHISERSAQLDARLHNLEVAKDILHDITIAASSTLTHGLIMIEGLTGYEHLKSCRHRSIRNVKAPAHSLEYWSLHVPKPDDTQSSADFMIICVYEIFSLLEDMCAATSQATQTLKEAEGTHFPEHLSICEKDRRVSAQLRNIYTINNVSLQSLRPIELRLRSFFQSWESQSSRVPSETFEQFQLLNKEEKILCVRTHWMDIFKGRTQDTNDPSAFLRRVNVARCLFCMGWVGKLAEIQTHFSKLMGVLVGVQGGLRSSDQTDLETLIFPDTRS